MKKRGYLDEIMQSYDENYLRVSEIMRMRMKKMLYETSEKMLDKMCPVSGQVSNVPICGLVLRSYIRSM